MRPSRRARPRTRSGPDDAAQNQLTELGHRADVLLTDGGETAEAVIREQLVTTAYDCVVIGAGIRTVASSLMLFEKVVVVSSRIGPTVVT